MEMASSYSWVSRYMSTDTSMEAATPFWSATSSNLVFASLAFVCALSKSARTAYSTLMAQSVRASHVRSPVSWKMACASSAALSASLLLSLSRWAKTWM